LTTPRNYFIAAILELSRGLPIRVRSTIGISKDVSFSLDTQAGQVVLQTMAMPLVRQAAQAIAARAQSMASSMSSNPPNITAATTVGTIKRGVRAIGTVTAEGDDDHALYIGVMALRKAKDAGRVK
jgi:hypothetical protein